MCIPAKLCMSILTSAWMGVVGEGSHALSSASMTASSSEGCQSGSPSSMSAASAAMSTSEGCPPSPPSSRPPAALACRHSAVKVLSGAGRAHPSKAVYIYILTSAANASIFTVVFFCRELLLLFGDEGWAATSGMGCCLMGPSPPDKAPLAACMQVASGSWHHCPCST